MTLRSNHLNRNIFAFGLTALTALAGCEGNATEQPTALRVRIENVAPFTHLENGIFDTKIGADAPGPLAPGDAYEFSFTAGRAHRLHFATMFGQSNDWFFGPEEGGIPLYDGDTPISGDITDKIVLWDAGTEVDEEPAVGPHTGPRQGSSTDGPGAADPDDTVRVVGDPATLTSGEAFDRPAVADMIRVTVDSDVETRMFTVRIENVADDSSTLQTSEGAKPVRISPGVWAIANETSPLFSAGSPDRGEGLEVIAEMGNPTMLDASLAPRAGVATPMSPGVYVLHLDDAPLFAAGGPDRGQGLEAIAEMGDPSLLAASLDAGAPEGVSAHGVFDTPVGASEAGAIRPGGAYELDIEALPGDRLSFAVMYGASNDWIFAPVEAGIALFDESGAPLTGDVTDDIRIWDVGTELSEEPAVGRFLGGAEGPVDTDRNVRVVGAGEYATPPASHIRVTISAR